MSCWQRATVTLTRGDAGSTLNSSCCLDAAVAESVYVVDIIQPVDYVSTAGRGTTGTVAGRSTIAELVDVRMLSIFCLVTDRRPDKTQLYSLLTYMGGSVRVRTQPRGLVAGLA